MISANGSAKAGMKEIGINYLRRKLAFLLWSYLIAAEKAEMRATGVSRINASLARIEFRPEDASAGRGFYDAIEFDEKAKPRRPPMGSRAVRAAAKSFTATEEEKTKSEELYKEEFRSLSPIFLKLVKDTDDADAKWVEANHAKKSNPKAPDSKEYEKAWQKEQDTIRTLFESTADTDKLAKYLKAYGTLRKGEPWPHQYDNVNRYPKEADDYLAHRKEELTFVKELKEIMVKVQSSGVVAAPKQGSKTQAAGQSSGQSGSFGDTLSNGKEGKSKGSGSGNTVIIVLVILIVIGLGIIAFMKRRALIAKIKGGEAQGLLEKPTDKEKPGEEKNDKSPDAKKKGEKEDKPSKDDKSKDAGKKGKDKEAGDKEDIEQDEDDRSMRSDRSYAGIEEEETIDIVTTPRGVPSTISPKSKSRGQGSPEDDEEEGPSPPSGAPRGKKRGKLRGILGKKDKPGPGGAKKPTIRLPGALRGRGKDKGSPPRGGGRGKSKPSPPGGKKPRSLVPPGVKKPTPTLKIPRI